MSITLKNRIIDFIREFNSVCKSCGRDPKNVQILFATKYLNPEQFVSFLHICKQIDILPVVIGENRIQDWQRKWDFICQNEPELAKDFRAMMVGSLQTNKINKAINLFEEIHSIDSFELAKALDERLSRMGKRMAVFLEVNVSGEDTKHGFSLEDFPEIYTSLMLLKSLKIRGLMTMAPFTENRQEVKPVFRRLRNLADKYNLLTSMGMSNDWKVAIEEGSDMIRIGARIFG